MSSKFVASLFLVLAMGCVGTAAPVRSGPLWHEGQNRIEVVPCRDLSGEHAYGCLAIQVSPNPGHEIVGEEYAWARFLWSKQSGQEGPDVLVMGENGGSGGLADLFAVSFKPRTAVVKIAVAPSDRVTIEPGMRSLCLNLPFGMSGFNQASNADTTYVSLPVCWSSGKFVLDTKALAARSFPSEDLRFRDLAVRYELNRWASDSFPATNLYPIKTTWGTPVTARALADLMLAGHADMAREMLHRNWPRTSGTPLGGEKHFWGELCRLMIRNAYWKDFHLAQIPHADVIQAGAAEE